MNFVNSPEYRIKYYADKGWAVEIQKKRWFRKYWIHIISWTGLPDVPYYFSTYESALTEATNIFRRNVKIGYA